MKIIMKGNIEKLNIDEYNCLVYLPPEYQTSKRNYQVIYVNGEEEIAEIIEGIEPHFGAECGEFILVSVLSENWNDEYSPWTAPALAKREKPFGGGASDYLSFLTEKIKPFVDENYRTKKEVENTSLIGYSLGGLVALYSLYISSVFGKIGSISGSLWFDGWTEFMSCSMPKNTEAKVYISLGTGEEHSKNQRLAKVGDCTRETARALKEKLISPENIEIVWNNGGHFAESSERYQKAIMWLMKTN